MIVLTEVHSGSPSPSAREIQRLSETARLLGLRVFEIPSDFSECQTARNAMAWIPVQPKETPGLLNGFIPTPERYREIHEECLAKRIRLLNSPEEFERAMELDRALPSLEGLTPESRVIRRITEVAPAAQELGFPLFVRGAVRSLKSLGWAACVAQNLDELYFLVEKLLGLKFQSRGRVLLRKVVALRHTRESPDGFPFGREFRVFLYRNLVLARGYYWEGEDPLSELERDEERRLLELAIEASVRLRVPYLAMDVGQLDDGRWAVIEPGDGQFAGLSTISSLRLLQGLLKALHRSP